MGLSKRACGVGVGLTLAVGALAQQTLNYPVGQDLPYRVDSGALENAADSGAVVFSELVHVPRAAWLRLYFAGAELPLGSHLRLTAAADGEVQRLDRFDLRMWQNTSAYFNGDTVLLELVAGPGTVGNRVQLDHVATQLLQDAGEPAQWCGICGQDDRVVSSAAWTCRLMPVGCTATIYNFRSCLVSAGHCEGSVLVAQFRVPPSYNCVPNHPPINDQFVVTDRQGINGGPGNDWMVMTTGVNSLGQTAYTRYNALRPISDVAPDTGDITMFGFGFDDECEKSQAQQRSEGWIDALYADVYVVYIDLREGNSGSAFLWKNRIIGVATHCSYGCPNLGTRIDLPGFALARNQLCPVPPRVAGDANCDDRVTFSDVNPFILALSSMSRWQAQYPNCNVLNLDLDCNGEINFADINGFVACMTGKCECP